MTTATATDKYLTFKLNKEAYAIDVMQVAEIIRHQKITPVPHMPPYFRGVINLRGKVIPVLDLRERFGLKNLQTNDHTCIIVVQTHLADKTHIGAGLIVDEVDEVMTIAANTLQAAPDVGHKDSRAYFTGITTLKDQVLTILDLKKLLTEEITLKNRS